MSKVLPKGWIAPCLGEIALQLNPGFPSGKHNREQHGVPHLRPMNVTVDGKIDLQNLKYVEVTEYEPLLPGDVLFNNTNSESLVGKTACIFLDAPVAFSNHMTRIRLPLGLLDYRWIGLSLHHLFLSGFFRQKCVHHVNQASIGTGFLAEKVSLPLPPLPEQERIVTKTEELFSDLDTGVEELKKAQAQLKRYRQSVLKAAFEGKLTEKWRKAQKKKLEPASVLLEQIRNERKKKAEKEGKKYKEPEAVDASDLPELPEGWAWARMGQIAEVKLGKMLSPKAYTKGLDQLPYLRNQNVRWGSIDFSDLNMMGFKKEEQERYSVKAGDLLVCEGGEPGRCAVYQGQYSQMMYQKALHRIRPYGEIFSTKFLQYCLTYLVSVSPFLPRLSETTIQHLPLEEMILLTVPVSSLPEQRRIIEEMESRFTLADKAEEIITQSLKQAQRLRQSILKRAFEGKLVPQDPNDEPAEKLLERIKAEKAQMESDKPKGLKAGRRKK